MPGDSLLVRVWSVAAGKAKMKSLLISLFSLRTCSLLLRKNPDGLGGVYSLD